ncbi:hypothetical protein HDU97_000201 [Phlyctochytrium planicorne]|nr:hypothetical protein HDU97_000201 [Phlyctochytrium planicorne]
MKSMRGKTPSQKPGNGAASDEDEYGTASKVDEMLEKRFQYGLEEDYDDDETFGTSSGSKPKRTIDDDDEDLNDETFGDIGDIGNDFDFSCGKSGGDGFFGSSGGNDIPPRDNSREVNEFSKPSGFFSDMPGPGPVSLHGELERPGRGLAMPMTVEEVEQQMRRQFAIKDGGAKPKESNGRSNTQDGTGFFDGPQQHTEHFPPVGSTGGGNSQFNDRVMSVTEVEAALASERYRPMMNQQQPSFPPMGGPERPFPFPSNAGPQQMGPGGNFMRPPPPHMGGMRPDMNFGRPPPHGNFGPGGSPRPPMNMPPQMRPGMMGPGGPGGPGGPMGPMGGPMSGPMGGPNMPMQGGPGNGRPHSPNMQRRGGQQNQQGRGQRQEYGQMRYGDRQRELMQETELFMKDMPRNYKGPPPLFGGWGGRRDHLPRWERYKDTMTQYEKETIAKIQIAQLVTDDPLSDDFYYQIYTSLQRGDMSLQSDGSKLAGLTWQQSLLVSTPTSNKGNSVVLSNQMQQQMQKLIEGRKQKPKGTSLALEGALGKISLNSVRNPKQLIQIQPASKDHHVGEVSKLTGQKILRSIETIYSSILTVEHMKRKGAPADEDVEEWKTKIQENISSIWKELHLSEPIPFTEPHPFLYFLSYPKGKKLIPRIIGVLAPEQILAMLTTVFARAESLDVCNMPAGTNNEQVDLFVTNVIPCLVAFVSEVPLHVVNACTRILLERHNMVWLARSRVGLAFLTMLLSRAEILKQGGGAAQGLAAPNSEDLSLWSDLYNFLFASLHNQFASIFPPTPPDPLVTPPDEVYVWQFLAAMAVGATTIDHQRVLVTEVRTKVIETSRRGQREDPTGANAKAIANVNLFLNALGLGIDASQLAAMG